MATNNFGVVQVALAAAVPNNGTVIVAYPAGTAQADYQNQFAGPVADNVAIIGNSNRYAGSAQVTFTYGAGNVTVTNKSADTWPAGATALFQMPRAPLGAAALAGIAALAANADLPTTVGKVNEIIAAL